MFSGVAWATDLIRLEIAVWDRVDARLRESHELPLAFFEPLLFISRVPRGSMRVGDLAQALRVTVGGTSKLVDRIETAGLIARELDPDDRRASQLVLTTAGKRKLTAALKTYEAEVGSLLDGVLRPAEQRQMNDYVSRLLTWIDQGSYAARLKCVDGPTSSAATVGGRIVDPFDSASTRGRSECRRPSARQ